MNINIIVERFLADAQYRIAELGTEINTQKKEGYNFEENTWLRSQLILWMDLLYESRNSIYEGYNYLGSWTDRDIQAECEYLRKLTGMANIPYITFAGYSPEIRNEIIGGGGGIGINFPYGVPDEILVYLEAGTSPVPQPFPSEGGMTGETIFEYFN